MKFKNLKTGRVYDLRDGVVVNGFCNHRACKDCPIHNKDTGESCVGKIYETPYEVAQKMGYEVLEQDYVTWVRVCDDQVDTAGERLSASGLYELGTLLTRKRFIIDDGQVKIITTEVKNQGEVKTLYALVAVEPTPGTEKLREALKSDSPPGFLVSYSVKNHICSICEKDYSTSKCHHVVGQEYDGKTCVKILDGVTEILDWGFGSWTAGNYREEKVKTTGEEEKMEKVKLPLAEDPKDLERFKAELRQKPCRDWTLGELQKFCQNTTMCSQECPFVDLCNKIWDDIIPNIPDDWELPSTFTERDQNDAYEEENNKEKEKIPPLCEVLRVQPCQEFIYKGIWYRITSHGERQAWYQSGQKWCWDSSCASLEEMIQERDKIQIGVQLTNEQKEELLRIKKMLPEAKKVFLTDEGVKVRMNSYDYKLNLDVVMPEGLDYEFEYEFEEEEK